MELSLQMWMVIFFVCVGFILQSISFCSPFWNEFVEEHLGLWQRCSESGCEFVGGKQLAGTMEVGRALQALGMTCYILLIVLVVLYICCRADIRLLTAAIIIAFLTLFAVLIGAVLWSSASNTTISWAYYLAFFSGLSAAAAGGVLIHVRRQEYLAGAVKSVTEIQHI